MAAPIFEAEEVALMMTCDKHLPPAIKGKPLRVRHGSGDRKRKIELDILSDVDMLAAMSLTLIMEETINASRLEAVFLLLATAKGRGTVPICHHDMHFNAHENPDWSDGRYFPNYQPHRHIYNPENVLKGDLSGLKVATPVTLRGARDYTSLCGALFRVFCRDIHLAVDKSHQMRFWE